MVTCVMVCVKEYERAVVFRLGRMLTGRARGPGVFFVIPCIDIYEKIDLRTQTYDVPPQEVSSIALHLIILSSYILADSHQGQRDGLRERHHVLQGEGQQQGRGQCGRLLHVYTLAGSNHIEEHPGDKKPGGDPVRERLYSS